ncbi:UNVERIFIED_CONTAM: hypothetical protein Sangu_1701600 [Sesamum angustifolium]|uniref:Uncharacterized protein n=1 Tax=Sesamum angustifolium TaxID=2727405 RepID=A0AAW2MKI8_9LAMI
MFGTTLNNIWRQLGHPVNQMKVFENVYKQKDNSQWSNPRAEEVAVVEGMLGRREQQRGTEYSVSAPKPTTRLLNHDILGAPLLLRPRRHSRGVTTCVIECRSSATSEVAIRTSSIE